MLAPRMHRCNKVVFSLNKAMKEVALHVQETYELNQTKIKTSSGRGYFSSADINAPLYYSAPPETEVYIC